MTGLELVDLCARDLRFEDPAHFRVGADRHALLGSTAALFDRAGEDWLTGAAAELGRQIYWSIFLGRRAPEGTAGRRSLLVQAYEEPALGRRLRDANAGQGHLDGDWALSASEGDHWLATKGGLTLFVAGAEVVAAGALAVGAKVALRFPKDRPYASKGHYTTVSDAGPPRDGELVCRIYVNTDVDLAPRILGAVSSRLRSIPHLVKVLNAPSRFERPDSLIVYLERPRFADARCELERILRGVALRPEVPAFAKPWLPGVAVAEDPFPRQSAQPSFGQHRSLIFARGIARAFVEGTKTAEGRAAAIVAELDRLELDPDRLHLNPGSTDIYPMPADGAA
jgi:hypothetical protein